MHTAVAAEDFECFVCPNCDRIFTEYTPYTGKTYGDDDDDVDSENFEDDEQSDFHSNRRSKGRKARNGPGTDEMGFEPKTKSTWLAMSDKDPNFPLLPSVKTTILKSILLKGFEKAPMDKVLPNISSFILQLTFSELRL